MMNFMLSVFYNNNNKHHTHTKSPSSVGYFRFECDSENFQFSSVQSLSRVLLFVTPWIAARQASLSITNSQSSLRLTSIIRPFFGGLFSKPPYHRAFPWPLPASFIPITFFLQNSPHKWHRIFPNFILCFPPLLCVYYSTIFCLQPFPYSNNYALSIKKIHFDKHFTSDSPTSYSR